MADVRSALLDFLRADSQQTAREVLAEAVGGVDLSVARVAAKDAPDSVEAMATMMGGMVLADATSAELMDAAKAAAQRAPRDGSGCDVALLTGVVLASLAGEDQIAEPYFRRARRASPAHPEVLAFYRRLFGAPKSATQLIQVLVQARRASADHELRFALAEEVAQIAEDRLSSPDRAIEMWRAVTREDGYEPRAVAALKRLFRAGQKWTALVDLLKDDLERLGSDPEVAAERIDKLLEIANLYRDQLKLSTMALSTLQRILEIDPQHEPSLEALAETYAVAGRWNDLLGVYAARIEAARAAEDQARQVDLLRKVAEIWVERLGNPQRALEPLGEVLAIAPKDPPARTLLARIHEQRRDFRALINLRREELDDLEGDAALELRVELARLAEERLGDRREAIAGWNEVLAHHGDIDSALAALARLYERENRWASAAEILHRKLPSCTVEQALPLLNHLGGLYGDRLQDRANAVQVWSELLRLSPGHDKAIRRLRDAYVAERDWDALTSLYAGQQRLNDVVEVLQSAADRISNVDERVALYRRVAALCQTELGQPERALKALERTLAIQPGNLDVARELVPIYREQKNWARLMSTYEVLLAAAEQPDDKLALIGAMQSVADEHLASPALTLHWAAAAYRIRPTDAELVAELETAAERSDGWDELTSIYEERLESATVEGAERLTLLSKLALIARDRLFKPDDAQRYFRRIVAVDPTNEVALSSLEEIYTSTRRWEDLSDIVRKRLEITEDPSARLRITRNLAKILEDHLGDSAGAIEAYHTVLELEPNDRDSLDSLARIHRNRGNWSDLAEVLQRKLDLESSAATRVPVLFELADIRATRLKEPDAAVEGFLTVMQLEPSHRGSVEALESLRLADPTMSVPVMQGLLPYYRRVEDRTKEAEAMEVLVAAETDPERRLAWLEQLAATYEKMPERRGDALRIRNELFRSQPGQWDGRQILQRLGQELERMVEVAGTYEAVLVELAAETQAAEAEGQAPSRERLHLRRDLLLEYAAILRDSLDRRAEAERAYRQILEMDETHHGAYAALEALLRQRGANEELVGLYRRRADVTFNQGEQRELLSRITSLSRHALGDHATAVATAEELLDLIPDDLATISLLADMYAEGHGPDDDAKLEAILGRQAELTVERDQARRIRVRQAALRMEHLQDAFGAVDLLGQVVGEAPDDEQARGLLERLLEQPDIQLQACAILEPLYLRLGKHEGQVRVLSVRRAHAEQVGAVDEAVGYLLQIARLREHELNEPATAFVAVREAYLMDPTRFDTREEVQRLGLRLGVARDLAEVWREALSDPSVTDLTLRIDLTTRLARLLDDQLRDQEAAREAYSELLTLDPSDAKLAHEAVAALCRLHLEAGDDVALIAAKRDLLRFLESPTDQIRTLLDIAKTQLDLRDRVGSALTYSEVLDMQPANEVALGALQRLFFEEHEWARLVEVLEHRESVTIDLRDKAAIWRSIGEIRRDQLGELESAIDAFQSVLDLKVGREETAHALMALIKLHEKLERWPDVEEGLRRLTAIAESDHHRVGLLTRTAQIVGKKLGRGGDALELLKRVLDLAPQDTRARTEVSKYLEDDDNRDRAIAILGPLYEAEQNWPALLELEELQARSQPSGRRRLQSLLQVARTQEERIGDANRAFAVLCEAMAEAADQPELESILSKVARLGAEDGRAEALLEAYGSTVDHILDSALQQQVLKAHGTVALQRLGYLDVARQSFERVLELSPDDSEAADALEQIYVRQDDHEALAQRLIARATRASDALQRDDYLIRAAETYRVQLNQPEDALGLYERLSSEGLEREAVQEVLDPLYVATERWRELASHLHRKLGRLHGPDAVETHLRLGRLYGQQLGDVETGIRHLSMAVKLDPGQAIANNELERYLEDSTMQMRVAEMLEPVFASIADWNRLIQIQEIRLRNADDESSRGRILLRIAQIEEEQLEDLDRAMNSYERLFKEQPTQRAVRDHLARLTGVLGQSERYAMALTEFLNSPDGQDSSDEVLDMVREAADLWSRTLRQPARAVPFLQRALDARPDETRLFLALESALTQASMWRDLADTYWKEAENSFAEDRQIELLRKLATVANDMLRDPSVAARAYARMVEIRPDYELARTRLESIYEQTERWSDLLELLRERLMRTDAPDARSDVARRIALMQHGVVNDPEGAVDTVESMLGEQPENSEAVVLLETIAQERREQRPRVLSLLRPIYERTGNLRRLIEIDEWQLAHTEDPERRHEIYREIAELHARDEGGRDAAFRILCRAVAEPGPRDALEDLDHQLKQMATQLGLSGALADALIAGANAERLDTDEDRRLVLLVWGANLKVEQGDAAEAAAVYRQALAMRDMHPPALEGLDLVLTQLGHHEHLASVLRRRVDVAEEDEQRVALLRRLATLFEDVLIRPADAERAWRDLLDLEPEDREALTRLSRVYEASGSIAELVDVLTRRIDTSTNDSERRDLRMQLANLHRETLKDRAAEIDTLRALLVDAPADDDALAALGRALVAEEQYADAADIVQERATLAATEEKRAKLLLDAARLYAGPLEDHAAAIERYEQVLGLQPGLDAALTDLVALAEQDIAFEAAGNLVMQPLAAQGRFAELAQVLAARAKLIDDPIERIAVLRNLAAVRKERLGDLLGALEAYVGLLDGVDEEALPEVLETSGRWSVQLDRGLEHFERLARRAADENVDATLRVMIAKYAATLAEEVLGERQRALSVLIPLLKQGVATLDVCERIIRLGHAEGDLELVEKALREAGRIAPEPRIQGEMLQRLGAVQLERGQPETALESYREAFEITQDRESLRGLEGVLDAMSPPPPGLLDALEHAYQTVADRVGQARVVSLRLENATEYERPRLVEQLANLCDEGGGSPDDALEAWGETLRYDVDATHAMERVLAIGRTDQTRLHRAVDLLEAAIEHARTQHSLPVALTLQAATVRHHELGEPKRALALAMMVLSEHSEQPEALQLAIAAAREAGEVTTLHPLLVQAAQMQDDVALWREAADVAERGLGRPDLAIESLEALLGVDEYDRDGWTRLASLLRSAGDFDKLAEILHSRVAIADDPDERRELRYRLANVLVAQLDLVDDAVLVYQDMLTDQPDDVDVIRELEVILRRQERWDDVREVLERKLDTTEGGDPMARIAVFMELAQLSESKLKDPVDAIERYTSVLTEVPGDPTAEAALERLLVAEERWSELAELLESRATRKRDAQEIDGYRAAVSQLASVLAERLDDPQRAKDMLDELLDHDASYVPALLAKAAVYETLGDSDAARTTLEQAATYNPQGQEGAALHRRLAALAHEDGDRSARQLHLERALQLDPSDRDAATRLLELAREREDWPQVVYLLEQVAARIDDPAERRVLILERVDLMLHQLGEPEAAIRILEPLYREVQDDIAINRRVADALFASERHQDAREMYEWLVQVGSQARRNKALAHDLTRLARIAVEQGEAEEALQRLKEAYRIDTTNVETLVALGDLHAAREEWRDALQVYRTMLLQNADQSGLMRRGDIYANLASAHMALGERPKARAMLRRGLEEDPQHPSLAQQLQQVEAAE